MRLSARILVLGLAAALLAVPSQTRSLAAQPPGALPQPRAAQPGNPDIEVLTRGPVHEAFASTAEYPSAGPVVDRLPPNPIEELPPDQKPDGDNVQWIPGYWAYDEERTDFIWISGFWRVPPPGRAWIAGSWREVAGGRQWVHGFWQLVVQRQQQQLEYLPPPPAPLELAPSVPQPTVTSYYVPGTWVHRGRFFWRPGYWMEHRPGWVWVPSHYRYTPGGYLFIDGYWDYPIAERGVLFAPVAFAPVIVNRPAYVYTPVYAVPTQAMFGALFVRQGVSNYYFGDYFEPRYSSIGFTAWCGNSRGSSFALSVTVGRGVHYDPLWSYYQAGYRNDPVFVNQINEVYVGRFSGAVARPPRTFVQQTTVVNNITNVTNVTNNVTNVTNNTTNINNRTVNPAPVPSAAVQNLTMVQPLKTLPQTNTAVTLKAVPKDEQVREQQLSKQLREVGTERSKAETQIASRQLTPTTQNDKPRQVNLEVPKQVVARAQAPAEPKKVLPPTPTQQQPVQQQPSLTATKPAAPVPPATTPMNPNPMKPSTTVAPTPEPSKVPSKPLPAPTPMNPSPAPVNPTTQVPAKPQPALPMPQPPKIGVPPPAQTPTPPPAKPMPVVPVMPPKPAVEAPKPLPAPAKPLPAPAPAPAKPLPAPTPVPTPMKPLPAPTPSPTPMKPANPAPAPPSVGKPGGAPLPSIPQAPTPPAKEPKKPEKPNG